MCISYLIFTCRTITMISWWYFLYYPTLNKACLIISPYGVTWPPCGISFMIGFLCYLFYCRVVCNIIVCIIDRAITKSDFVKFLLITRSPSRATRIPMYTNLAPSKGTLDGYSQCHIASTFNDMLIENGNTKHAKMHILSNINHQFSLASPIC